MTYSVIGLLAVIIHAIINYDILRNPEAKLMPGMRNYRRFLICELAFLATDALWGVFYEYGLSAALYADTVFFFIVMGLCVLLWTTYVVYYLERKDHRFGVAVTHTGRLFFGFQLVLLGVNAFVPILFSVGENGEYCPGPFRYLDFGLQMLMFLLASVYTLHVSVKSEGTVKHRHRTIGLFGLAMILAISAQIWFPLLPLYSIGYLLGGCVLHTFVVEDEKNAYLHQLEAAQDREAKHRQALGETLRLAYTDSLTGVKSKRAWLEAEERIDGRIGGGTCTSFGIAVFDLNDLKKVNDTLGHDAGDAYIVSACKLICDVFRHSPVYRIGGDEFAAILEGRDQVNGDALMTEFDRRIEEYRRGERRVVVASGLAAYTHGDSFGDVFHRADKAMFERKRVLKGLGA